MTEEAAQHNFCVLSKYEKDLDRALEAQEESPLGYRSEFRATSSLQLVFGCHPNWQWMKTILEVGSDWPMEDLDPKCKSADVMKALEFGNHRGATKNPELLKNLVS